jgi:hypothetical protein
MTMHLRGEVEIGDGCEPLVECRQRVDRALVLKCNQECVVALRTP